MELLETSSFTRQIVALLDDDTYAELQHALAARPDMGDLIKGGKGLRKVRWKESSSGKRGGVRIIYYWVVSEDQILMLLAYPKKQQDNLTQDQLKQLVKVLDALL